MRKIILQESSVKKDFRALGTDIFLEIILDDQADKDRALKVIEEARELLFSKEKIFSRFDRKSEISRLNLNLERWQKASRDILYLAKRALYYNKISNGLYDPRIIEILECIGYDADFKTRKFSRIPIPPEFSAVKTRLSGDLRISGEKIFFRRRMDFSGIAKGYIVDCVAQLLRKKHWKKFLVDAGGDMNIEGLNSERKKWRIAVEGVRTAKLMLAVSDRGIATSGISRKKWEIQGKKFHHLVNPKKPNEFSYELRTVSVIAKNTENADGRAKTLVLMGKEKGLAFAKYNKIAAVFLDYRGDIFISPEAKKYILK